MIERQLFEVRTEDANVVARVVIRTSLDGTFDSVNLFDRNGGRLAAFRVVHPAAALGETISYNKDEEVTLDAEEVAAIGRVHDFRIRFATRYPAVDEGGNGFAAFIRRGPTLSIALIEASRAVPVTPGDTRKAFVLSCPTIEGYRIDSLSVVPFDACFSSPTYLRNLPYAQKCTADVSAASATTVRQVPLPAYALIERRLFYLRTEDVGVVVRVVIRTSSDGSFDTVQLFDRANAVVGTYRATHPTGAPGEIISYNKDAEITLDAAEIAAIGRVREFRNHFSTRLPTVDESRNGFAAFVRRGTSLSISLLEAPPALPTAPPPATKVFVIRCPTVEGFRIEPRSVIPYDACFSSPTYLRAVPYTQKP